MREEKYNSEWVSLRERERVSTSEGGHESCVSVMEQLRE